MAVVLMLVVLFASWLPARRATQSIRWYHFAMNRDGRGCVNGFVACRAPENHLK
jgi:hypothetical protein